MYNLNRLKDMLVVMEDCVLKLENFNKVYASVDNVEAKIYMEEGFRGYIRAFQEQLIKYLAHTSKGLYHRKSRNYVAHGYEHPDFQVIYEFYKVYKNEFDNVINCIRQTIYQSQNNECIEDRKQKDELYSSLEMAKKLIPLLEGTDEEIAEKTGLDVNLIKSIRYRHQ